MIVKPQPAMPTWHHQITRLEMLAKAGKEGKRYFPYEYMYQLIKSGVIEEFYQIDPKDSWVVAACAGTPARSTTPRP